MNILCVILARGGSKGLPGKNIAPLAGKPLISYPINYALESRIISDLIVSTDSLEIAEIAKKYGARVPFIRPLELSEDLSTTEVALQHAILTMENIESKKYDFGVFLTATDIFRQPGWIEEGIKELISNPEIESFFIGTKTHKNFWKLDANGEWTRTCEWMKYYGSRQTRQSTVREDTGLTCISRAQLWREGRRIGDKVQIKVVDDPFTAIDIHTREDLELAEYAIKLRGRHG